jgi:hypothetical protein
MRIMFINGRTVGRGMWTLPRVMEYCAHKGIELERAYSIYSCPSYAATDNLDIVTGEYSRGNAIDHIATQLG